MKIKEIPLIPQQKLFIVAAKSERAKKKETKLNETLQQNKFLNERENWNKMKGILHGNL